MFFLIALVVFAGVFTQTVSGFGMGLIMMPLMLAIVGTEIARPLVALIGITVQFTVFIRLRKFVSAGSVGLLVIGGVVGIPLGNWIVERQILNEQAFITLLALVIIGYALYALFAPRLPELKTNRGLVGVGLASGVLTGAYNVGGPPVVIYADARRWTPDQLRGNLQGFFFLKSIVLILTHALSGNFTLQVWQGMVWSVPAIVLGIFVGFWLHPHISVVRFRQIVLILLLLMGGNMLRNIYLS